MQEQTSAGGVVYKRENGQTFWLICKHAGYKKWVLPKGHIEAGENLEQTAMREVEEETGVRASIVAKIPQTEDYTFKEKRVKIHKTVHYFLMEYVSGDTHTRDREMEDVQWVTFEKALNDLAYDGAKRALTSGHQLI